MKLHHLIAGLAAACSMAPAFAQTAVPPLLRDPMQPPAAAATAASAPDTAAATENGIHILVIDGQARLLMKGRLLSVGELLGDARIERITADEVWLRDAAGPRRVPLYPGVTRRPSTPAPAARSTPPPSKDHP